MAGDITPGSPVSALWPDGEGGLTGARARARLESAGIATAGMLRSVTADDILAIPRAGKSVLAEIRRALAAQGLSLALDPPVSRAEAGEARRRGREEAERAAKRKVPAGENPVPVSAADFAALVADLRKELESTDPETRRRFFTVPPSATPASFAGRPWAWHQVGPSGAADLTGYAAGTIRAYAARAERAHAAGTATERTMPQRLNGKWATGSLALWTATRNEGQAAGLKLDDEAAQAVRAEIDAARPDGGVLPAGVLAGIAERYGVSAVLVKKIAYGDVPAEGRRGAGEARRERHEARAADVRALYEQAGRITARMVTDGLGVGDYRDAARLIASAGLRDEARRAEDEDVASFLAAEVSRRRRFPPAAELLALANGAGLDASLAQVRRLMRDVRAAEARRRARPTGNQRARGESMRPDGLLTQAEVGQDWGVPPAAVAEATRRGDIFSVKAENGRRLYDPRRLRARTDRWRTPVDVTHPKARLEPGDPGYRG